MKTIPPAVPTSLTDDQLAALAALTGKTIHAQDLPFLGRTVIFGGKRFCGRLSGDMPSNRYFETALEQRSETAEVVRFYVGSKHHGPVLSVEINDDGCEWHNCFAKHPGGWGRNVTCGGTWQGQSMMLSDGTRRKFATWQEALANRYNDNITVGVDAIKFKESETFIAELTAFLAANA